MNQKYQPVDCHYYDELELLAMRQQSCEIIYSEINGQELLITDTLIDFKTSNHEEFVLLKSGLSIRLDRLVSVDGKVLKGFCGI